MHLRVKNICLLHGQFNSVFLQSTCSQMSDWVDILASLYSILSAAALGETLSTVCLYVRLGTWGPK